MEKVTAVKFCKQSGLKSVRQLSGYCGVKERTLFNIWNNNRIHFECLVAGVMSKFFPKDSEEV